MAVQWGSGCQASSFRFSDQKLFFDLLMSVGILFRTSRPFQYDCNRINPDRKLPSPQRALRNYIIFIILKMALSVIFFGYKSFDIRGLFRYPSRI